MKQQDYSNYILPVGGLLLVYLVAKRFGLVKDTQAEATQQGQLFKDYFSPNYLAQLLKQGGKTMLLTTPGADYIATEIYKSKGIFNDDEGKLYSAIKSFRYKSQVSQVAKVFAAKYQKDLAQYLQTFLNANELNNVYSYTDKLPTGKV